jgi:cytochrome b6-f complex iron-sulfur subunit
MQSESTTPTQQSINRAEFLRSLGLSSGALMALYCMGTLTACSKSGGDDPAPTPTPSSGITGNNNPSSGAVDFTLDLTNANYSKLKTDGQFVQSGGLVIANAKGTYVAVSNVCTHQGGTIQYRATQNDFRCDLHGGLYSLTGAVVAAPPVTAIKAYKATLSGNSLRITA